MPIKGLHEWDHGILELAVPLLGPAVLWYTDPRGLALQRGLRIGLLPVALGNLVTWRAAEAV